VKDLILLEPNHPIFDALMEIQKPRSRFQLESFVAGQHDTDEQKYKQVLLEIQSLIYSMKHASLDIKKMTIEADRLRATGDEIDAIEAEKKELSIEQSALVFKGAQRELQDLVEMWEAFPHKYSYEEIEQNQPVYWESRLVRQAQLEALGSQGKIGWASLDSLRQIGKIDVKEEISNMLNEQKELEQ
jgi:hypothetical protein